MSTAELTELKAGTHETTRRILDDRVFEERKVIIERSLEASRKAIRTPSIKMALHGRVA